VYSPGELMSRAMLLGNGARK